MGVFDDRVRANLQCNLIKPSVARLSESLDEIQAARTFLLPVLEGMIADGDGSGTVEMVIRRNLPCAESGKAYEDLKR